MALSDVKCRNTRPSPKPQAPSPKLLKLSDGGGRQLWLQPTGARLWRLAYRYDGKQKLLALLFPRPGELRAAEWPEFDLDKAVWTIPASRTKMRRVHCSPLSRRAVAILWELHEITGGGTLVFPNVRRAKRSISDGTLNAALRRLGYSKEEVTAHFKAA